MSPVTERPRNSPQPTGARPTPRPTQPSTNATPASPSSVSPEAPATRDRTVLSAEAASPEAPTSRLGALRDSIVSAFSGGDDAAVQPEAGQHGFFNVDFPSIRFNQDPSHPNRPENIAELQRIGVPDNAISHPAGAAAAPVNGFSADELNPDGTPRVGTLVNELRPGLQETSHRYVTVNPLDAPNRELAEQAFFGFNAPTHEALSGQPNPSTQTEGRVDPTAPLPLGADGFDLPEIGILGLGDPNEAGGHVSTHRGHTPEGTPYAINTTTPGDHPLRGHITRSLIEHEGDFYIRTEGVGSGATHEFEGTLLEDSPLLQIPFRNPVSWAFGGGRDTVNSLVGPPTFHNLDRRANDWVRAQQP